MYDDRGLIDTAFDAVFQMNATEFAKRAGRLRDAAEELSLVREPCDPAVAILESLVQTGKEIEFLFGE